MAAIANPANAPGVHGLNKMSVSKLGRRFNADYVVRGRIIEYNLQKEHTWALKKKGVLPFIMGGTTQAAFGFAETKDYDNLNNIALWGLAGAIIGYNADTPFNPETTTVTPTSTVSSGDSDAEFWNTVTWGWSVPVALRILSIIAAIHRRLLSTCASGYRTRQQARWSGQTGRK